MVTCVLRRGVERGDGEIEATSCQKEESRPSAREDAGGGDWSMLVWLSPATFWDQLWLDTMSRDYHGAQCQDVSCPVRSSINAYWRYYYIEHIDMVLYYY